ncbi:MAG: PHP domain-containing protein [Kiritimatiellae bacterium]|nr:PHP domain-containing protein [Kiritimatiellia bacterium]
MHTKERSGCAVHSAEDMIQAARDAGLDGMVISDHDRLVARGELMRLRERYAPFRLFTGIEVSTVEGEHVLVLGLPDQRLESKAWSYARLHAFVRAAGAFLILAHPYRFQDLVIDVEGLPPDAVELRSGNIRDELRPRIRALIERIGCATVYCSDAHHVDRVGYGFIELDKPVVTDQELLEVLKAGAFHLPPASD